MANQRFTVQGLPVEIYYVYHDCIHGRLVDSNSLVVWSVDGTHENPGLSLAPCFNIPWETINPLIKYLYKEKGGLWTGLQHRVNNWRCFSMSSHAFIENLKYDGEIWIPREI